MGKVNTTYERKRGMRMHVCGCPEGGTRNSGK